MPEGKVKCNNIAFGFALVWRAGIHTITASAVAFVGKENPTGNR